MTRLRIDRRLAVLIALLLALPPGASSSAGERPLLVLDRTIALPGVIGRIDHMDVDGSNRLIVAALGADAVEIVDLESGKRVGELRPFHKPQGVRFVPSVMRLFVANGDGGGVVAFDHEEGPPVGSLRELDDADNLRVDASEQELIAGYGQALAMIDVSTLRIGMKIPLSGHPEGFVVEQSGPRIFVNVPTAGHVAVVDRHAGKVMATWPLGRATQNFPMALDEKTSRLFISTRQPALLLVLDSASGRRLAELPTCRDADDLFFDSARKQLYVVCGEGFVEVIRQVDADHYESAARIPTAKGARTGFFDADRSALYVAAPAREGNTAEIRVFRVAGDRQPATVK